MAGGRGQGRVGGECAPTTGLREHGNDTSRNTGRSGRQKAATRRNMRRDERVTVQGPVKTQRPDGMSQGGGGGYTGGDPTHITTGSTGGCPGETGEE